jgi:hypothetical protein
MILIQKEDFVVCFERVLTDRNHSLKKKKTRLNSLEEDDAHKAPVLSKTAKRGPLRRKIDNCFYRRYGSDRYIGDLLVVAHFGTFSQSACVTPTPASRA